MSEVTMNNPTPDDYEAAVDWLKNSTRLLKYEINHWSQTDAADTTAFQRRGLELVARQLDTMTRMMSFLREP